MNNDNLCKIAVKLSEAKEQWDKIPEPKDDMFVFMANYIEDIIDEMTFEAYNNGACEEAELSALRAAI